VQRPTHPIIFPSRPVPFAQWAVCCVLSPLSLCLPRRLRICGFAWQMGRSGAAAHGAPSGTAGALAFRNTHLAYTHAQTRTQHEHTRASERVRAHMRAPTRSHARSHTHAHTDVQREIDGWNGHIMALMDLKERMQRKGIAIKETLKVDTQSLRPHLASRSLAHSLLRLRIHSLLSCFFRLLRCPSRLPRY
jgi:hypothetical protein